MLFARALLRFRTLPAAAGRVALLAAMIVTVPSCGSDETSPTDLSLSSVLSARTKALGWGPERELLFAEILKYEVGAWDQPSWPKSGGVMNMQDRLAPGRAIYVRDCADCHGLSGQGDGPSAADLPRPPRDFSLGVMKYKSSAATTLPWNSDLQTYLQRPLDARPEDGCKGHISGSSDVTVYTNYLLTRYTLERSVASALNLLTAFTQSENAVEQEAQVLQVLQLAITAIGEQMHQSDNEPSQPKLLDGNAERGRDLFTSAKAACATCHGHDGAGKGPQTWEPALGGWVLKDMWGHAAIPGDFTRRPWRSGDTNDDLARSIRVGIGGTPMPSYSGILSEAEIADLVAYIITLSE